MDTKIQPLVFVGIDRDSRTHQVCILSSEGTVLREKAFVHSVDGCIQMVDWILACAACGVDQISVAINPSRGLIVELLMDRTFRIFSIKSEQLDRLRDRFSRAGKKHRFQDSRILANAIRTEPQYLYELEPLTSEAVQLREYSRRVEELNANRIECTNRFREELLRYYPQFFELKGNLYDAWLLELWKIAPTPERARQARFATVAKVMKKHRIRRLTPEQVIQILRRHSTIHPLPGTTEAAVFYIRGVIEDLEFIEKNLCNAIQRIESLTGGSLTESL